MVLGTLHLICFDCLLLEVFQFEAVRGHGDCGGVCVKCDGYGCVNGYVGRCEGWVFEGSDGSDGV